MKKEIFHVTNTIHFYNGINILLAWGASWAELHDHCIFQSVLVLLATVTYSTSFQQLFERNKIVNMYSIATP